MVTAAPITGLTRPGQVPGPVLAIDYGRKRLGLALSDELGVACRPIGTWNRTNRRHDLARLRELARKHHVRRIIVGLPLHLDGATSKMAEETQGFAARVQKYLGIPVEMMDERLSSWEAQQTISASGSKNRRRGHSARGQQKPSLDEIAAAIILREYLDRWPAARLPLAVNTLGEPDGQVQAGTGSPACPSHLAGEAGGRRS